MKKSALRTPTNSQNVSVLTDLGLSPLYRSYVSIAFLGLSVVAAARL